LMKLKHIFRNLIILFFCGTMCEEKLLAQVPGSYVYEDVTNFQNILHILNSTDDYGSGLSFFDINKDGWDDLTLIREDDTLRIFFNQNGNFLPAPIAVYNPGETKQVLWVDYDNDDDYDLFITTKNGPFRLLRNVGNFDLVEFTIDAGLNNNPAVNYGASFGDIDNDGWLDLYVCRYHNTAVLDPFNPDEINRLFRNNGDGTFTDISISSGAYDGHKPSFQSVFMDYNRDGLTDIYVINDRIPVENSMYRNNGDLTFDNVADVTGSNANGNDPMSNTVADFNNDGNLDIYMSNSGGQNEGILLLNSGGQFTDVAQTYGVNIQEFSWGADFVDRDNDGFQDLIVCTANPATENYFYTNNVGIGFTQTQSAFDGIHLAQSFAVAKGDMNNDGYYDLVIQNNAPGRAQLLKNTGGVNNYLKLTPTGVFSNRMAVGTWVNVFAGGSVFTKYVLCGENYLSQNSQHLIFGMGVFTQADSVIVTYPSGIIDRYYNLNCNQHYYLTEAETFTYTLNPLGPLEFCPGDSVVLDAGEYAGYYWSTGDTSRYLTVTQSGNYQVTVFNPAINFTLTSNVVNVNVIPPPIITFLANHVSCYGEENGSIQIQVNNQGQSYSIVWNNGLTGNNPTGLSAGVYTCFYTDTFSCTFSDSIQVVEPDVIIINAQTELNSDSTTANLLWSVTGGTPPYTAILNGVAYQNTANNLAAGNYELIISDANNCSDTLDVTITTPMGERLIQAAHNIQFFPNPSTGNRINYTSDVRILQIEAYSISGQQIPVEMRKDYMLVEEHFKGILLLRIYTNKSVYHIRIIIY
jgi:hypothetical protein